MSTHHKILAAICFSTLLSACLWAEDKTKSNKAVVGKIVGGPKDDFEQYKKIMNNKKRIANFFINREIDIKYKDNNNTTLLMSTIESYMPKEWKFQAAKILVDKGSDINAKDNYSNTAIELAKYRKEQKIVELLSK